MGVFIYLHDLEGYGRLVALKGLDVVPLGSLSASVLPVFYETWSPQKGTLADKLPSGTFSDLLTSVG